MKANITLKYFFYFFLIAFSSNKAFTQCFEIESILVAACIPTSGTEGFNEMVRFKVGSTPINISALNVNWPSQTWQGLAQNAATAVNVAAINAQIAMAGGCGQVLEPVGGVIPANATVLLITSYNFTVSANAFGAISQDIYILFQDNASQTGGHFGNYTATPSTRTLTMTLGSCSDTVSYDRSLLVTTTGSPGSAPGATVNFVPSGTATYTNPGCVAPVEVFSVEAGTTPVSACPGTSIVLTGSAIGYTSVGWTAPSGSFSAPSSLNTNYTLPASATGSIVLTLTATNPCGTAITDNVTVNVSPSATPTFNSVAPICAGDALASLPTTSTNGITGAWSPAIDNMATITYTFTPNVGQCAVSTNLIITVNLITVPTFNSITVCSGATVSPLPTTSLNGISGFWSPAFNNTTTTTYTFVPSSGTCVSSTTLTVNVNAASTVPTFNPVAPICAGDALAPLPSVSVNGISGVWSPPLNNLSTITYNFTPDAGQCATPTTLTITVNSLVTPTFTAVSPICSGSSTAALPLTSTNGIVGTWSPAINNIATTTYTFTPNSGQCAAISTMVVSVNSASTVPTFASVAPICAGTVLLALPTTSTNGIVGAWSPALNNFNTITYTFTPIPGQCSTNANLQIVVNPANVVPLFSAISPICAGSAILALPLTSTNGITGAWSPPLNSAGTTTYTFTPNTTQCAVNTSLVITVVPIVFPNFITTLSLCNGSVAPVLNSVSPNGISGSWSPTTIDNSVSGNYVFTPTAGQCAASVNLSVVISDNEVNNKQYFICLDSALNVISAANINTGLSSAQYSFYWSRGTNPILNTTNSYQASVPDIYTVVATNLITGCTISTIASVTVSPKAVATATVSNDFDDVQQIVVTITGGAGNYLYQLDNGPFQGSNIFHISKGGDYTIHVKDDSGCNNFELYLTALGYPKFFTPNGDGFNDTWNISGLPKPEGAKINIFDRYGKLVKEIAVTGNGWNGIYNERELPASDYWFVLFYQDKIGISKEFKGHFSLKR